MQRNQKTIKTFTYIINERFWLTLLLCVIMLPGLCIDFSILNTSYWYDKSSGIILASRAAANDSTFIVFLEIEKQSNQSFKLDLLLQNGFEDANHERLTNVVVDTIYRESNMILLQIIIERQNKDLLVVELSSNTYHYYFPVRLYNLPSFYPVDSKGIPIVKSYFSGDISFKYLSEPSPLIVFQYADEFGPADPPMGSASMLSPNLKIDTVYSQWTNSIETGKFYLIQQDTFSTEGLTLMSQPDYFPELRQLPELIESSGYITRKSEYNAMLYSGDNKKIFENFWLRLYPNQTEAKLGIRSYYRNVEWANRTFSHYKSGWKNDPGMVYIVFGNPGAVYRYNNKEIWVYEGITFEYRLLSHLFTPNLMILIRKPEYEREWFTKVRELRGGN